MLLKELRGLVDRVYKIAYGSTLMTEIKLEKSVYSGVPNLLGNKVLEKVMHSEFYKLGPVIFDESDKVFPNQTQSTLTEADILDSFQRIGIETPFDMPLCDFVSPLESIGNGGTGSTDMGDVN